MISLKKYLDSDAETAEAFRRVTCILLQGMGLHAVELTAAEHAKLRATLDEIATRFAGDIRAAELMPLASIAIQALEDYNRRTAVHLQKPVTEFRAMARKLASAIATMAATSHANVSRMREIEGNMLSASLPQDVRLVKESLLGCLDAIRAEGDRQETESGKAVEALSRALGRAPPEPGAPAVEAAAGPPGPTDPVPPAAPLDPLTGLALRPAAEVAILNACREAESNFVAVFSLEREEFISLRYGRDVTDSLFGVYAQFVRGKLRKEDSLFRWTGFTLVAVVRRPQKINSVRDEIGRIMNAPLEHTVTTATRTVLLPIAARWVLLNCLPDAPTLLANIDNFARSRTVLPRR